MCLQICIGPTVGDKALPDYFDYFAFCFVLLQEVILTLLNATGGGVIGVPATASIFIGANDNPHGIVEFTLPDNLVLEMAHQDSIASIMVTRR